MKFSNYQAFLNSRLLGLLPYTHSGHNSSLGISWWHETSLFEQYILQLQWPTTVTAKPKTSRQKQNTSRQSQKPHGKNKIPHSKTKKLTAKPNTSQREQNSFGFAVGICFCRKVFGFCCEVFGFAVSFLVLLWGILFLPWGFWFCRDVFVFAVRFLVLPWQLWATIRTTAGTRHNNS